MSIKENIGQLLSELPPRVQLIAVAKGRSFEEVLECIEAGVQLIGENYVQDAERIYPVIGQRVGWHLIGHLQRNKVKRAVALFDMIETVDSVDIAREINWRSAQVGKRMPVLIEINSGREEQKSGVFPDCAEQLAAEISSLENLRLMGLMTIGTRAGNPEDSRPYFRETRRIFDRLSDLKLPNTEMKYLSMGMSNSYKVAIQEGANIIRIGTKIFGERKG